MSQDAHMLAFVLKKKNCYVKNPNRVCHSEPRHVLQSMVTPMEDMRDRLKSIVNQAKDVMTALIHSLV